MEINNLFNNIYKGKKVLITGQTGFKGSWLTSWMISLGAKVYGVSDCIPTKPSLYELLKLDSQIESCFLDINDGDKLQEYIKYSNPDIVFHLAAQPLVLLSYEEPLNTLKTNIIGTANLFEACRQSSNLKAIVNVTSDKCYYNQELNNAFKEDDKLGGYDPYSASKACSEIITECYRKSFFSPEKYLKEHNVLLASARAGNVIGGGDWAENRLIPDIAKSTHSSEKVSIRNPYSIRPWQHVLEPLSGYMLLGQKLLEGKVNFASSWNFGPDDSSPLNVKEVLIEANKTWDKIEYSLSDIKPQRHEAKYLKLDISKAKSELNWNSVFSMEDAIKFTIEWYMEFYENGISSLDNDILQYVNRAKLLNSSWAKNYEISANLS